MPRLWTQTIQTHRHEVREAILDAAAALVAEHGLLSVTMSQIAEATGIGRATLYKYFPDVEAILIAWHERQVTAHMHHLMSLPDQGSSPGERLAEVLMGYAIMSRQQHGTEFSSLLHHGEHVQRAQQHLRDYVQALVVDAVQSGEVRDDIPPAELVSYCLHALHAVSDLQDPAAIHRLVEVTLAGIKSSLPLPWAGPPGGGARPREPGFRQARPRAWTPPLPLAPLKGVFRRPAMRAATGAPTLARRTKP